MRKTGDFRTRDGLVLKFYEYECEPPKAVLLHIHGIAGTIPEELDEFAEKLCEIGVKVYRLVLRGYPPSEGKTGDIDNFEKFVDDVVDFYKQLRDKHKNIPIFVMGHSLGGSIVIHAAAKDLEDAKGIILQAPGYKTGERFKLPFSRILKTVFGALFARSRTMIDTLVDPELVRHPKDREELKKKIGDPHYVHVYSPRFLLQARKFTSQVGELARKCKQPMLIIYGEKDDVINPRGNIEIYENWAGGDKEIFSVPDGGHGTHVAYESLEKIKEWIMHRINVG